MKLVQLVYFSKSNSKPATKNDDIKAIYKTASEANGRLGISGLLLFSNEYFLQALEGPRQQVNDLYFRFLNDPRLLMLRYYVTETFTNVILVNGRWAGLMNL
jgi:hypothetical protein